MDEALLVASADTWRMSSYTYVYAEYGITFIERCIAKLAYTHIEIDQIVFRTYLGVKS